MSIYSKHASKLTLRMVAFLPLIALLSLFLSPLSQVQKTKVFTNASSKSDKVQVCHNGKVLFVSVNALAEHLGHGDRLGSCDDIPAVVSEDALAVAH